MIHFFFLVNKLGQTRIARYYSEIETSERRTLESELVRKCLARTPEMVSGAPTLTPRHPALTNRVSRCTT